MLDPTRSQAHHPLFQVALFFQNMSQDALELSGLEVSGLEFDAGIAKFDLQLTLAPRIEDTHRIWHVRRVRIRHRPIRRVDHSWICRSVHQDPRAGGRGSVDHRG
ncbi:hypothetical protein ACETU7_34415 [Rhodococcus sp. 3Y1]